MFAIWYFTAVEPEPKIDVNEYDDLEHLAYLIGLDGIVSDETGFLKAACKALFPSKECLLVDQFVNRINHKPRKPNSVP